MRKVMWLGAIFLALGAARPALAQRSAFSGINPGDLKFTPVDTRNVVAGATPPTPAAPPKFLGIFPKMSFPSFFSKPIMGKSTVPVANNGFGLKSNSQLQPLAPVRP